MSDDDFKMLIAEISAKTRMMNDIADREFREAMVAVARGDPMTAVEPSRASLVAEIDQVLAKIIEAYFAKGT